MLFLALDPDFNGMSIYLFSDGEVYNFAGVAVKNGVGEQVDGMFGQWSLAKLDFYANFLLKQDFRLVSGQKLDQLATFAFPTRCPTFTDDTAPHP